MMTPGKVSYMSVHYDSTDDDCALCYKINGIRNCIGIRVGMTDNSLIKMLRLALNSAIKGIEGRDKFGS